jgi:hypothetical protein
MAKGRTNSPYSLSARRIKAVELFVRGYTVTEVATELRVSVETASRYRTKYQEDIKSQAVANPTLLKDVLANTIATLGEIDQVRQEAWRNYENAKSEQLKAQFLNTVLKAQEQRAKLFGLFGVKAELLHQMTLIREQQEKLVEFMSEHLCSADRERLETFILDEFKEELRNLPETELVDGH